VKGSTLKGTGRGCVTVSVSNATWGRRGGGGSVETINVGSAENTGQKDAKTA